MVHHGEDKRHTTFISMQKLGSCYHTDIGVIVRFCDQFDFN